MEVFEKVRMEKSNEDKLDLLFKKLRRSKFRSRFKLKGSEAQYLKEKGIETIVSHARDFITKRLASAEPKNDGKQTPFKGHPVFIAQHATATCCRGCLEKWHKIPKVNVLTLEQIDYIINVIQAWIRGQTAKNKKTQDN